MNNFDIRMHVRGESVFIDDIAEPDGLLHAVIFTSPAAKGIVKRLDVSKAKLCRGVRAVFTAKDVPGDNQIGHVIHDQPLFAVDKVNYAGEPLALVVAATRLDAVRALKHIECEIEKLQPILDPREAFEKNELIQPPRRIVLGDVGAVWEKCATVVEGRPDSGGQEHFYFETQAALAVPLEAGSLKVFVSSQGPGGFHHSVAHVLGVPRNQIEIDIRRLGGGFGGKEACALWAAMPALAAKLLNRPVKLVLSRREDIATTGKRHPFSTDFKLGLDKNHNIVAYQARLFQDAGAYADISTAVLERCMLHTVGSYRIPNVQIDIASCRTNTLSNTAFRGFGVPQAVYAIESAIFKAAETLGIHPSVIQRKNLLVEGDMFHYEMKTENCNAVRCWDELDRRCGIRQRIGKVEEYNRTHSGTKKGIAVVPVCFGISFTQTSMNQAGSLVHLYTDGSVGISTGAVEMGQGVNSKIRIIAAKTLSISHDRIKIETTNTSRIANASPTSASTGSDLNGMAVKKACEELVLRLRKYLGVKLEANADDIELKNEKVYFRGVATDWTWEKVVLSAYADRVDLSCHGFYATPRVYLDRVRNKGVPFAYHSYGTSITEVTIDCCRGTYTIDSIDVVHDVGESLSWEIDRGQAEGAIMQGIGWSTIENIVYNKEGRLLSSTNSYKIPDIKFVPETFNINFLENSKNPYAVYNSKAVGEPPFIHGLGTYFALLHAARNCRNDKDLEFSLPMTPEKLFMYLHG